MSDAIEAGEKILVAKIRFDDHKIFVRATEEEIINAIFDLTGTPTVGKRLQVEIEYVQMTEADFLALPELQ